MRVPHGKEKDGKKLQNLSIIYHVIHINVWCSGNLCKSSHIARSSNALICPGRCVLDCGEAGRDTVGKKQQSILREFRFR